tara:strand:+ start:3939 stop:4499 length:561 start_codon:yes stop_codon:yes gene_type:complete
MSECTLIKKVQEGDSSAFSELVDQNKNLVYSIVLRMVKNQEDAEEVAQDAFIKAFHQIKKFRGDSKFSTWIYKIAYFCAVDHLRKRKQLNSSIDLISIASDDDSVLDNIHKAEKKEYLNQAIAYLKPIDRNLISMHYMQELSIEEIEKVTLFSHSNIKVKLMRIRKQLNGILTALMKNEIESFIKS